MSKLQIIFDYQEFFICLQDEKNYARWKVAVSPYMKKAPKRLYVCDLHFDVSKIEVSDIVINADGAERTVPRQRLRLKKGSVPSIFDVRQFLFVFN